MVDRNVEMVQNKAQIWATDLILNEPMVTLSGIVLMFKAIEIMEYCKEYHQTLSLWHPGFVCELSSQSLESNA